LVKSCNQILKDSQQLLQEKNEVRLVNNQYLYSCDFESLYTNMDPYDTTRRLSHYLYAKTDLLKSELIDIKEFQAILKLIFSNNIFKFNDKFYLQQIGIPMGCKSGPAYANVYLHTLEYNYINRNPTMIYYRFIDDIFISMNETLDKEDLCRQFPKLKLNISEGEVVNFLDLNISHDRLKKEL
jgi:hypothetical protein